MGIALLINKTKIAHFSVYDLLGWCMSRAVVTLPPTANRANFYLPLLTLYAHWCAVVREPMILNINMVSISWFGEAMILGATIPEEALKPRVQQEKLGSLNKAPDGKGPGSKDRSNLPQIEVGARQQFGHCAETNQYLTYCHA